MASSESRTDELLWNRPNPTQRVNTKNVRGLTMWCSSCGERQFVDFGKGNLVKRSEVVAVAHEKGIACEECKGMLIDTEHRSLAFGWTKKPIIDSVGGFNPAVDTAKYGTIRPEADYRPKQKEKRMFFYG